MRIKNILLEKGITAKSLANSIGLSEMGLSNILTEKSSPNANTIIKIANALGVKCGELFDDFDKKNTLSLTTHTCPHCGKPITIEVK